MRSQIGEGFRKFKALLIELKELFAVLIGAREECCNGITSTVKPSYRGYSILKL
jgi:hypothetical protein